jgi:hypothetical protein
MDSSGESIATTAWTCTKYRIESVLSNATNFCDKLEALAVLQKEFLEERLADLDNKTVTIYPSSEVSLGCVFLANPSLK